MSEDEFCKTDPPQKFRPFHTSRARLIPPPRTTLNLPIRASGPRVAAAGVSHRRGGERRLRLLGLQRVELALGASRTVTVNTDPRLLALRQGGGALQNTNTGQCRVQPLCEHRGESLLGSPFVSLASSVFDLFDRLLRKQ
jgi:hypothetical protein